MAVCEARRVSFFYKLEIGLEEKVWSCLGLMIFSSNDWNINVASFFFCLVVEIFIKGYIYYQVEIFNYYNCSLCQFTSSTKSLKMLKSIS